MSVEKGYYIGFAEALMYAQAHNDREGGQQTFTTHLPQPSYTEEHGFEFDKNKLSATIRKLDEEGGITVHRFGKDEFGSDTIEMGGSEGHFGLPEWEDE